MPGCIRHFREGPLGWLVIDQPERHNAVSAAMWAALPRAAQALESDPEVRVILLRGAGERAFVSGADISEFETRRSGGARVAYDASVAGGAFAWNAVDKPVIAMIHGICFGGGVGLALAADLRYAADDALFCIPAARLGVGYPAQGFAALERLVGPASALEIFFTARRYAASEAQALGLVNAVWPKPELESRVRELALRIAENAPLTLRCVKRAARELRRPHAERDQAALDAQVAACFESEDYREGTRAFLEKRAPRFRGC